MNHIIPDLGAFFTVTLNPGDYHDTEGYIVCGVCNERRQQMHGQTRIPRNCACDRARNARINTEAKAAHHRDTVENILRRGRVYGNLRNLTFASLDDHNAQVTMVCQNYVDRCETALSESHGILLYGNPGTGKSHHAYAMINALAEKEYTVFCGTIQSITAELFSGRKEDSDLITRMIRNVDFLLLDDFGAARNTDTSWEQVFSLIDMRYNARKPLILTTNLSPNIMETSTDKWMQRIYSRICEMCQIPLPLVGEDRRKQIAAAAREDCRKLYL